ncbi:type VII secretion target, partial [Nocardia abscessus]|uniref:type VII secretion target n=1 Tax=Nocardia abscessus TaxID=120957 RepID=UPI002458399C
MPNSMEIDPAVLRQLADQHDRVARDTREWAKPPADWLANFLPTYGKIAYPVYEALERYYDARQRAGEALASEHERTRDSLRASADAYEESDDNFASQIRQAGDDTGQPSFTGPVGTSTDPLGPSGPTPPFTPPPGGPPSGPVSSAPDSVGPDGTQNNPLGTSPGGPNAAGPNGTSVSPSATGLPGPVAAPTDSVGTNGTPNATGTTPGGPPSTGVTAPTTGGMPPTRVGGMPPTGVGAHTYGADDSGATPPPSG